MRLTTLRPVSRGAAVALAAAALALAPVAAHADDSPTATTTSPAPATTTAVTPPVTTSGTSSTTSTTGTGSSASSTSSTTAPTTGSTTSTTSPAPTTTSSSPTSPSTSVKAPSWTAAGGSPRTGVRARAKAAADGVSIADHAWFLQNQLATGGHHLSTTFDGTAYADAGLTADAVLALDAAGTGQAEAARATTWLEDNVASYMGGGGAEAYAGATAKLLNVAGAQGVDPTDFGGVDLVDVLLGLEQPTGQFKDRSNFGDFSNTIGQSLAITGLVGEGLQPSGGDKAVDFLLAQQCSNGGFRISFGASPCVSDNDATSYAVQALVAAELLDPPSANAKAKAAVAPAAAPATIDAAIEAALAYLEEQVGSDGGVKGGSGAPSANANSTGLVAQALAAVGEDPSEPLAWLAAHSYDCAQPAALRGGFAYDDAALAATVTAGARATVSDPDVRASTQALLGLAGVPLVFISADGAASSAGPLACSTPTATSTTATIVPVASTTGPGSLAYTGAQVWPLGLMALALILVGAAAIALTRRGGAHA